MAKYELRIETSELKKALDVLVTTINRKNALPIMSDVRIGYNRDAKLFSLIGSNTEQWMEITAEKMDENGERKPWMFLDADDKAAPFSAVCINAMALKEAFGTLPSCPVMAQIDTDKLQMRVDYNTGHFEMPVDSADEYPIPATPGETKVQFTIATKQLLPLISAARCCVDTNELRPIMSTVCIDVFHDHCVVVASNGHVMYRRGLDTGMGWLKQANFAADTSEKLLIPMPALNPLIKALAGSEKLNLTADASHIWLSTDGISVGTVTQDGNYPNYDSVIPRDASAAKVVVDKAEMAIALRRVSIFSSESSNMVVMCREDDHLLLASSDVDFGRAAAESVAIINTDTTLKDGFKIGCKISSLAELLQCVSTDNVRLSLTDPTRPILLFDDDDKSSLTLLIMPMLID